MLLDFKVVTYARQVYLDLNSFLCHVRKMIVVSLILDRHVGFQFWHDKIRRTSGQGWENRIDICDTIEKASRILAHMSAIVDLVVHLSGQVFMRPEIFQT